MESYKAEGARAALEALQEWTDTICGLLSLADQRELVKDGPCGDGSECFNNLDDAEKAKFYRAAKSIHDRCRALAERGEGE